MQGQTGLVLFFLQILANFCIGQEKNCEKHEEKIELESLLTRPDLMLPYQKNNGQQVIFIESSGRSHLDSRQACAVESAARSGNLCQVH